MDWDQIPKTMSRMAFDGARDWVTNIQSRTIPIQLNWIIVRSSQDRHTRCRRLRVAGRSIWTTDRQSPLTSERYDLCLGIGSVGWIPSGGLIHVDLDSNKEKRQETSPGFEFWKHLHDRGADRGICSSCKRKCRFNFMFISGQGFRFTNRFSSVLLPFILYPLTEGINHTYEGMTPR
jgi:hypothetical protein